MTGSGRWHGFDLKTFWDEPDEEYTCPRPTAEVVAAVEAALGRRLPPAYVALCQVQNGGLPLRSSHRTATPTSWAEDHVTLHGIFGVGEARPCSLCGEQGSRFWVEEWGYPDIGIYFADCPSAGHDMICLDYRACGPTGEPAVVHVDQERRFEITPVAATFEAFIRGLEDDDAFDEG